MPISDDQPAAVTLAGTLAKIVESLRVINHAMLEDPTATRRVLKDHAATVAEMQRQFAILSSIVGER